MPNKKNRDKKKISPQKTLQQKQQRQPTTKESLIYWINQLNNQSIVVKIGFNEMEKARINLIEFIKKMDIEDQQVIKTLMETIEKTSKCPKCRKASIDEKNAKKHKKP